MINPFAKLGCHLLNRCLLAASSHQEQLHGVFPSGAFQLAEVPGMCGSGEVGRGNPLEVRINSSSTWPMAFYVHVLVAFFEEGENLNSRII